jgi:hypothetical protein
MIGFKHILCSLSLGLLLVSCKKEITEIPESNNPLFVVGGNIGEESVHFTVGDNGALFSNFISTVNGVPYYGGTLTQGDTEIQLGMYRGDNDLENLVLDNIINLDNMDFASLPEAPLFEMKREYFSNESNIKEIKWFVDGEYAGTNTLKIIDPGKYQVCAHILYSNKYTTQVCNDIIVGYRRSNEFELKFSLDANNQLSSWIDSDGQVADVKWYLNDELVSKALGLSALVPTSFNLLKAEITFADGSKRVRTVMVDGTQSGYSIEDFAKNEQYDNLSWDYKLKLNIKHNGNEYSSMNVDNSSGSLQVNSINYYGLDPQGNPVYIISGILNSKVKSKSTNDILSVNLNISWGLSLK